MIVLNATNRSLEVALASAVATNQLPIVASYVDTTTTAYTPGSSNSVTNNTTAVTAIAAPAASTQRQVKLLTAHNADTAAATLTISYNDNGTVRTMFRATIDANDTVIYTDGEGFRCLDANGQVKFSTVGGNGYVKFTGPTQFRTYTLPDANDTAAAISQANSFTRQYRATQFASNSAIDWNDGNVRYIQLASGAQSFSFANPVGGGRYVVQLRQPASGAPGTVNWPANVRWSNGTAAILSIISTDVDLVSLIYDSVNACYYGTFATQF